MSSEPESCEESEVTVEGQGVECEVVCETETCVVGSDEEEQDEDDTQSETLSVDILEGQRPVRPVERQKMRPWLIDLLDKNILPGLSWQNKKEKYSEFPGNTLPTIASIVIGILICLSGGLSTQVRNAFHFKF